MAEGKITVKEARIVKLSDKEYFSKKYDGYISNSRLNLLDPAMGGSSEAFLRGFDNRVEKSFFSIGTAVHALLLQPQEYIISKAELPPGKLGLIARMLKNMGMESTSTDNSLVRKAVLEVGYYGFNTSDEKISKIRDAIVPFLAQSELEKIPEGMTPLYLSKEDMRTVINCVTVMRRDEEVNRLLSIRDKGYEINCFNEHAILGTLEVEGEGVHREFKVKCKLDRFIIDESSFYIQDLKTTHKNTSYFKESIRSYRYDRQAAFYKMMLEKAIEEDNLDFDSFKFLVVSTSDFSVSTVKVPEQMISSGMDSLCELFITAANVVAQRSLKRDFNTWYSLKTLPVMFGDKMKLIGLLCLLLQHFRKKQPGYTVRELMERIRKEKINQTSGGMLDRIEVWVEEFYDPNYKYPTFGFTKPKEMSDYINSIMDKELPFSDSMWEEDLPF